MRQLKIVESKTIRDARSLEIYFNELNHIDLLTPEEEAELAIRIQRDNDQEALRRLVAGNLRFAISVAKQYKRPGVTLSDLINEANIGLIKAAYKFDPTTGFKFISYAVWWVRQCLLNYLTNNSRIVRIPLNRVGDLRKMDNAEIELTQKLERTPTVDELLEYTSDKIKGKFDEETYHDINVKAKSLEYKTREDNLYTVGDQLPSNYGDDYYSLAQKEDDKITVNLLLNAISTGERELLEHKYGLNGRTEKTVEELAKYYDVSGQTMRNRLSKVHKRLKTRAQYNEHLLQELQA